MLPHMYAHQQNKPFAFQTFNHENTKANIIHTYTYVCTQQVLRLMRCFRVFRLFKRIPVRCTLKSTLKLNPLSTHGSRTCSCTHYASWISVLEVAKHLESVHAFVCLNFHVCCAYLSGHSMHVFLTLKRFFGTFRIVIRFSNAHVFCLSSLSAKSSWRSRRPFPPWYERVQTQTNHTHQRLQSYDQSHIKYILRMSSVHTF
jgi:hypothetical protein